MKISSARSLTRRRQQWKFLVTGEAFAVLFLGGGHTGKVGVWRDTVGGAACEPERHVPAQAAASERCQGPSTGETWRAARSPGRGAARRPGGRAADEARPQWREARF